MVDEERVIEGPKREILSSENADIETATIFNALNAIPPSD
jgi:hypothetical protein